MISSATTPKQGQSGAEGGIGLVDVLPTFLAWTGMAPLTSVEGRSALDILEGKASTCCRPVISEEALTQANTGEPVQALRISARTPQWKYIVTLDLLTAHAREEAYDLQIDPLELDDLAGGTGRLPDDTMLDACLCAAIEAVRDRIWVDLPDGSWGVPSDRPLPCQPGRGDPH